MDVPLIDVLIAVYNSAKTIRSSIESIQAQTITNIRILVVDDGSTDDTLSILNEIGLSDPRLVILPKPHSGIVDSLTFGLSHCKAEFIARFDGDDISYPHRFESQLAYLRANPTCMAVASAAIHIDVDGKPLGTIAKFDANRKTDASWIPARDPYLLQPFLMVRKSSIDKVKGYRFCDLAEDSDLYWRLSEIGDIRNTDEVLGAYRMNPHSISSKSIINGRRISFCSELIGISALRRRNGLPDITFSKERISSYKDAVHLEEFCRLGSAELSQEELVRLRLSSSVKLMEFAAYRPYELEEEDCRFIRTSLDNGKYMVTQLNQVEINNSIFSAAMRLVSIGRIKAAYFLVKFGLPYVVLRVALKSILPKSIRNTFKSILGMKVAENTSLPNKEAITKK